MNPSRYGLIGPYWLRDEKFNTRAPGTIAHIIPGLDPPAILTSGQAGCGTENGTCAGTTDGR